MKHRFLLLALAALLLPLAVSSVCAAGLDADANLATHSPLHQIHDEADPTDQQSCESMGQIGIAYETGNAGPPNIGLRVTDPRGRKIGYDPRAPKVWQDLPRADGFVECNEMDDQSDLKHCAAHIQICGPVSGVYKLEVLPTRNSNYSITVIGASELQRDQFGPHSTASRAQYKSEIRKQSPDILMLNYSREAGTKISLSRNDAQVAASDKSRAKPSGR